MTESERLAILEEAFAAGLNPHTGLPLALTSEELACVWTDLEEYDGPNQLCLPVIPFTWDGRTETMVVHIGVPIHVVPDDVSGDSVDQEFNESMLARLFAQRDAAEHEAARLLEDNKKLTEERDAWRDWAAYRYASEEYV